MTQPAKRVYLHIGAPKTGTTYLQDVLFRNREALADQGLLVPGGRPAAHYEAVLDLRDLAFRGHRDPRTDGAWAELVEQVERWRGSAAVISHELLSGADEEAIARAVSSLADAEVHVVYTARDLGRQVPAMWQESIKNGQRISFEDYLDRLSAGKRRGREARIFWRQQHVVEVMQRWAEQVPPDRLHIVLVPAPGQPADVLWRRFADVLGVRGDGFDLDVERVNVSLGLAEAELLRRVNVALDDDLAWPQYEPTVKGWFAEQVLAGLSRGHRPSLPRKLRRRLARHANRLTSALATSGWDVVGDLSDLEVFTEPRKRPPSGSADVPDTGGEVTPSADEQQPAAEPSSDLDEEAPERAAAAVRRRSRSLTPTDTEVLEVAASALAVILRERAGTAGRSRWDRPGELPERIGAAVTRGRQLWRRRRIANRATSPGPGDH